MAVISNWRGHNILKSPGACTRKTPWSIPNDFKFGNEYLWRRHAADFMDFSDSGYDNGDRFPPTFSRIRHVGLYLHSSTLYVFFTIIGHSAERILVTSVNLNRDCWYCVDPDAVPREALRAETPWEGGMAEPVPSRSGPEYEWVNDLREPYIFEDGGNCISFMWEEESGPLVLQS